MATQPVENGQRMMVDCLQSQLDDAEASIECLNQRCAETHSDDFADYRDCVSAGVSEMRRQEFLLEGQPQLSAAPEVTGMGTVRVFEDPTGRQRPVVDAASLERAGRDGAADPSDPEGMRIVGASAVAVPMTMEFFLAKPVLDVAGMEAVVAGTGAAAMTAIFGTAAGAALGDGLFLNPNATRRIQEVGVVPTQRNDRIYMMQSSGARFRSGSGSARGRRAETGGRTPSAGQRPPEQKEGLLARFWNWVTGRIPSTSAEVARHSSSESVPSQPAVRQRIPEKPLREETSLATMVIETSAVRGRQSGRGRGTMVLDAPELAPARRQPVESLPLNPPPVAAVGGPFARTAMPAAEGSGYIPAMTPRPVAQLVSGSEWAALQGASIGSAAARTRSDARSVGDQGSPIMVRQEVREGAGPVPAVVGGFGAVGRAAVHRPAMEAVPPKPVSPMPQLPPAHGLHQLLPAAEYARIHGAAAKTR